MELDYGVGKILSKLSTLGIDQNTLVIFSSDNGAATYNKDHGQLLTIYVVFLFGHLDKNCC